MPSLVANHKNQETVARLQKAISVLNNGMGQMMALEGVDQIEYLELMNICGTNVSSGEVQACLQPYFKKFFNIVQDNVGVPSSGGDFYPAAEFKFLNGTKNLVAAYWGITQRYAFVTGDGILYVPFTWDFSGSHNALVDINAKKGPNQIGRDIFILKRNGTTFVPAGGETWDDSSSDDYCNPQSGKGYGCSARIMQEGWKINY